MIGPMYKYITPSHNDIGPFALGKSFFDVTKTPFPLTHGFSTCHSALIVQVVLENMFGNNGHIPTLARDRQPLKQCVFTHNVNVSVLIKFAKYTR